MNRMKKTLKDQGGFTLIEMLIVVAIIAILIAISIPVVNSALEKARQATDAANVRAAKAAALVDYMTDGNSIGAGSDLIPSTGTTTPVWYRASDGMIVDSNADEGYGKSTVTPPGSTGTPKGNDIKIVVSGEGECTLSWE